MTESPNPNYRETKIPFDPSNLEGSLRDGPKELRDQLARGFRAMLAMTPESLSRALPLVARDYSRPPDPEGLGELLGVPKEEAVTVASALAIFMTTSAFAKPDDFFSALVATDILSRDDANRASALIQPAYQQQKATIERHLAEERLASSVLPNLTDISWTVDLRSRYTKQKLSMLVPVAIVDFSTDVDEQLRCQLSENEVEKLLHTLQLIKTRMEDLRRRASELGI